MSQSPSNKKSLVVYTTIFGDGYFLAPAPVESGVQFILFTDQDGFEGLGWQVRHPRILFTDDPVRNARSIKLRPHVHLPDFSESLYVDPSVSLTVPPSQAFDYLMKGNQSAVLGAFIHSFHDTLLDEIKVISEVGLDDQGIIDAQLKAYTQNHFDILTKRPVWSGILARRHTRNQCVEAMDIWFAHVMKYSRRDQVALPLALQVLPSVSKSLIDESNHLSPIHRWPRREYVQGGTYYRPPRYESSVIDINRREKTPVLSLGLSLGDNARLIAQIAALEGVVKAQEHELRQRQRPLSVHLARLGRQAASFAKAIFRSTH
mgnify:CR=1 FL=1